ncbi:transposase [Brevibacterium sp. SMBL_HHYL_HB1]|uniref:transposase n=1 Tax=Brevibacterium sp. SMBL_HHYL_HB1 TaxID=2777556 RepID=UPI001BA78E5B|nr:transposase [Brevibacterium sp. SMBL_HHYL_HB1]QUL79605.1 transposase [Brevibacterium sp. SMBL_HHYL_HB1]
MKKYSDEFKADAVALYETHPDMSYSQVAADLGISRGAIKSWVFQARKEAGKVSTSSPDRPETPEEELARCGSRTIRCAPISGLCGRMWSGWKKSERSCGKPRNISRQRRPGDPLPVR